MRAVRFDAFGGLDVLEVREVDDPVAGRDHVLVRLRAAAINPGEIRLREGVFADQWPTSFPSGQGSDLAGVVDAVGEGVTAWAVGDEVLAETGFRRPYRRQMALEPFGAGIRGQSAMRPATSRGVL